jgi:RimJ/RimL family protein N-acetyltransferase
MNPVGSTRLESAGAVLECSLVPWDSEIFGYPVAQIDRVELDAAADPAAVLDAFEGWCASHDVRLVSCRLDHTKLRESMALEERGFRFVEMVYGPRFDAFESIGAPRHEVQVSEATEADVGRIEDVAYTAFTTGRFLLDGRLTPELSRRRYATWVRTSFESSRQTVLKAEVDGDLVGFLIVEHRSDRSVYWHLTAIAPDWQGKGMGLSLWQTMLVRHGAEGASYVETTISGHNLAIINLYARLGFSFASAQMTFHWLRDPAAVTDR